MEPETIFNMYYCPRQKKIKKKVTLVSVYGPPHDDNKEEFLIELSQICTNQSYPALIGGDFNILRFSSEKNKKIIDNKYSDRFNHIINTYELRELGLLGGKFTWSNNQQRPTLEKLDRVLMNDDWEKLFPLTSLRKIPRYVRS